MLRGTRASGRWILAIAVAGRAREKALAAKDAFWYVVGHVEEPRSMLRPLCARCHPEFAEGGS